MEKKNKTLTGIIVSDKMQKTAVVEVLRLKKHPKYKKYYKVSRNFKAHNPENQFHTGDKVVIKETKPMSKDKRWIIVSKDDKS
jgi:small subunit ribosomal protein S17